MSPFIAELSGTTVNAADNFPPNMAEVPGGAEQIAQDASHELRTPLSVLRGNANLQVACLCAPRYRLDTGNASFAKSAYISTSMLRE